MNFRRGRRFNAFIACLATMAMLAAAFMPSLSYALAARNSVLQPDPHEYCTASPAQTSQLSQPSQPLPHAPQHGLAHGAHCALCLLHLDTAAPPPSAAAVSPLQSAFRLSAPAFLHARRSTHVWIAAQPRAPPAIA
jgi:hypothetical protein